MPLLEFNLHTSYSKLLLTLVIFFGYHAVLGDWTKERLRIQAPDSSCLAPGCFILKQRDSLAPQITLWITLFVLYPHQGKGVVILLLPFIQAYVGLRVGMEGHVCLACIAESKTRSEQKRVIQPDQDVQVCGLFLVIHGWTPFAWLFLPLLFSTVSYQHFFLTCICKHVANLLWVCIFSFLFFLTYSMSMWSTFFG